MKITDASSFQKKLLHWYGRTKRDLPWRKTRDPYKILVSEIMLQQTQVVTVIPYYERWLKRFPDFATLAKTDLADVLKSWQGLGYYRRAKMLHQTAQIVARDHRGRLPDSVDALLNLPGIGRYTAGAIASIAYDSPAPILDGNVIRILTRLFAIKQNIADKKTIANLWSLAEKLLPGKKTGDFNQAMMELGAMVCAPQNPNCKACPVAVLCSAFKAGNPEKYPVKNADAKITKLEEYALIVRDSQKRLLVKKQQKGERWADLWALPHFDSLEKGLSALDLKKREVMKLRQDKHGFTRYAITLHTFQVEKKDMVCEGAYNWMDQSEIRRAAFPAVHQKILDAVLSHD